MLFTFGTPDNSGWSCGKPKANFRKTSNRSDGGRFERGPLRCKLDMTQIWAGVTETFSEVCNSLTGESVGSSHL